ncbi:MAG: succinylglutamate desuccinylase/aspartoacylase family protein [Terrimicrobiaceae bacterium]|nr:succinylglutamate desuccinylase/aspartoacylase family protein [Terrimicrobiaceae bacterium]
MTPVKDHHSSAFRHQLSPILSPLEDLSSHSDRLFTAHLSFRDPKGVSGLIPRFLFTGPGDRGSFLRVGVFAGIHGDEISGILAATELLHRLHEDPSPALGYELFVYPVCNPWGFSRQARWLKSGADMNREFWRGSDEIEVLVLEGQLMKLAFDGIVALHTDDTSEGLYGFVRGSQLSRHVLEPSLAAASRHLPRNTDPTIDNFRAENGVIDAGYTGILGAPPTQKPRPFEVVFETPHRAPLDAQVEAHITAVLTMLERFRRMISEAQNI